jgi:phage replication O-like protein O
MENGGDMNKTDIGVQLENGFTKIANELLQVVYGTDFNATQLKIILLIIRFTYGYQKKDAEISLTFISKGTGISKRYVSSELKKLIESKVILITRDHSDTESRKLKLNKCYKDWVGYRTIVQQVKDTSTDDETRTQQMNNPSPQQMNNSSTKKENNKENNKEKEIDDFFEKIWKLLPKKKGKAKVLDKQKKYLYEEVGEKDLVKAIKLFNKEMENKDKQYIPYGSTFLNSGYVDYLDQVEVEKNNTVVPTGKIRDYNEYIKQKEEEDKKRLGIE